MPLPRSLKPFLLGLTLGILLTLSFFAIRELGRGFASWGALELHTDAEVRTRIQNARIHLPDGAHHLFHASAGFVDSQTWIKFTVPPDQIWTVVAQSLQKTQADFVPTIPENLLKQVHQNSNQTHDLTWWQPTQVKNPASWSNETNPNQQNVFEDWLIDLDTGTFYITRWDT